MAWSDVLPQSMTTIMIELVARRKLAPGAIDFFSIESPEGVMFTDPNMVF